jgi:RNA polymerase sigma-70 factor (ECF subfamily)
LYQLVRTPMSQCIADRRYVHVTSTHKALTSTAAVSIVSDFDTLFQSQFARLARLIRRIVNDPAEAEDLATHVLWKCFRKQPAAINLEGWLSRTAVRAALDSIRRRARRRRYEALWPITTRPAGPDDLLEQDGDADRVRRVLARITPRFATLLLLRAEGSGYRELADALGIKPSSVGTLLARAEASFRKEYVKRYGPR